VEKLKANYQELLRERCPSFGARLLFVLFKRADGGGLACGAGS
jgi:hypothetical protein